MAVPRVFLADFGLARNITTGSRYTRTGETLGTPAYMSPELARGEVSALTPAADVWALGCVLHETLAGRRAFEGASPAEVIAAVLTRAPAPLRAGPTGARTLVAAALQRDGARRPASAATFRDDCARVLAGARPRVRPPARWPRWPALAGVVAALTAGAWLLARGGAPPGTTAGAAIAEAERCATQGWGLRQTDLAKAESLLARAVDLAPARHDWRIELGLVRWARGDDASAEATWAAVPDAAPESTRAWFLRGLAARARFIANGDGSARTRVQPAWRRAAAGAGAEATWARAGLAIEAGGLDEARALLGNPTRWEAALLRGSVESRAMGMHAAVQCAAGIQAYTIALSNGVPLAWAHIDRGALRMTAGDDAGALEDTETALRLVPGDSVALANRGALRVQAGDLPGALADFEAALASDPRSALARAGRGNVRRMLGDPAGALVDLDAALARDPAAEPAQVNRGHTLVALGDFAAAEAAFSAVLARSPAHVGALMGRASAREGLGRPDDAAADYGAVLASEPRNVKALENRGTLFLNQRRYAPARADLDAAVALDPINARARVHRAMVREALGDLAGAREDCDAVLARDPRHVEALVNRGALRMRQRDLQGAAADYDAALAAEPGSPRVLLNRGALRQKLGELEGARRDFDAVLDAVGESRLEHCVALGNRGIVKRLQGDAAGSVADLDRAAALAPPESRYRQAFERALALARADLAAARPK